MFRKYKELALELLMRGMKEEDSGEKEEILAREGMKAAAVLEEKETLGEEGSTGASKTGSREEAAGEVLGEGEDKF